jgi:hypothetical protein
MTMIFKYKGEKRRGVTIYRPRIRIIIKGPKEKVDITGLLDSGSDAVLLPRWIGDIIGTDFTKPKEEIEGLHEKIEAVEQTVTIQVKPPRGHEPAIVKLKTSVLVEEWKNEDGEDIEPLLGRDFFRFFDITFKESEKKVELKRITQ